jgi:hypothetical protein
MNKLVVVLCVIIIVKDSGFLFARDEVAGRDNSVLILKATAFLSHILKAAAMKNDETVTPQDKANALADIIEDVGVLGVLITRSEKVKREFLKKLQEFFVTRKGKEFLQELKAQIVALEASTI